MMNQSVLFGGLVGIFICGLIARNFREQISFTIGFLKLYVTHYLWEAMTVYMGVQFRTSIGYDTIENAPIMHTHTPINVAGYYVGTKKYTVVFQRIRGPCPFSKVLRVQKPVGMPDDVTEKIKEFAGPSHNFHGIPTTPEMLGESALLFHLRSGSVRRFEYNDVIKFT